jgi:unsaturated rhamnogalacturonyl hydrolase
MDVDAPFLLQLGRITNDESYVDQGLNEILGYARALQVESNSETDGLFWHGYEEDCGTNGQLWARGNGWAVMGLVETLKLMPDSHPARQELRERLDRLIHALKRHQDESGLWHTVIIHPETYLESTLAVMTAFALHEAFAGGLTDPKAFGKMERDAREAAIKCIKDDGALDLVSDATPIGELKMYATRPFGVFPWGQGPVMLMLAQDTL